jgi:hypothetical protein
MRSIRRVGVALLLALAPTTVLAQRPDDRIDVRAAVGPSFANVGTTFSALGDVSYRLTERLTLGGELGMLRHAPFRDAWPIAPPLAATPGDVRVNGYHWNGNLTVRPFDLGKLRPYVTGGLGAFTADAIVPGQRVGGLTVEDRRRITDFATNVGGGVTYPVTDRVGVAADYRSFFVHRDVDTPRVHRFTTGLTFAIQ